MLDVKILTSTKVLFEGQAEHVVMPGERGVFDVYPYHKSLVSRLYPGTIFTGSKNIQIKHGIAKVHRNKVTVIVEPDG